MTDDDNLLARLTGFTPSPWRIRVNVLNDRDTFDVSICGDIFVLADLNGPQYAHQQPNAALIAAAPDLHRIALERGAEIARLRDALTTARADAIHDAADACTNVIKKYDVMKPDGKTYESLKMQKAAKGMVSLARQDIEALAVKP